MDNDKTSNKRSKSNNAGDDQSTDMTWSIVLGVVGGVLLLSLIGAAIRHMRRSCDNNNNNNFNNNNIGANLAPEVKTDTPVVAAEGKVAAFHAGTNEPYSENSNQPGDYRFILYDGNGNPANGTIEFAYSIANSSGDASCLHITPETYQKFTYTTRDKFSILTGTLCVAAICKDPSTGAVTVYANSSFAVKSASPAPEDVSAAKPNETKKDKKQSKKNGLFNLIRNQKKDKQHKTEKHPPKDETKVEPVTQTVEQPTTITQ